MPEPAAMPATLTEYADQIYSIERFYSLVAGASEDRICVTLRDDLRKDALHAAYTLEAWLEEINGREEKYDRLANLARSVAPISDLLQILSKGVFNGLYADLVKSYEEKYLRSFLAQRYEFHQSASEVDSDDQLAVEEDPLTSLISVVSRPDGRDDYVAWFQIGWLYWKRGIFDEAESAFRTAASFSQRDSQWYHAQSLRHEAFMQWRRGNFERSRATIRRAVEVRRDPPILIEAARYAISCGQVLESQSFLDEALNADPLIFVSVLADVAFNNSVTSTVDILVRQQKRSSDNAQSERESWEAVINTLRVAERQGKIKLLPSDADTVFAETALTSDLDFPTAIFRAEEAKLMRAEWARVALERVKDDVVEKQQAVDDATEAMRVAKLAFNQKIDAADTEQCLAEIAVQDEHSAVKLPNIPPLKDEMIHGLVIGLSVLIVGTATLAILSQWKFKSIPPLSPLSTIDYVVISPILIVMVLFGLLGVVTFPAIRLSKANRDFNAAAFAADENANQQLRVLANDGAKKRQAIKLEWTDLEGELHTKLDEAERALRASLLAQGTVKLLFP